MGEYSPLYPDEKKSYNVLMGNFRQTAPRRRPNDSPTRCIRALRMVEEQELPGRGPSFEKQLGHFGRAERKSVDDVREGSNEPILCGEDLPTAIDVTPVNPAKKQSEKATFSFLLQGRDICQEQIDRMGQLEGMVRASIVRCKNSGAKIEEEYE